MHIAFLNYVYEKRFRTPADLLTRYAVIPQWCTAVRRAGASKVSVVQRFGVQEQFTHDDVDYSFFHDNLGPSPHWWQTPAELHRFLAGLSPDIIHLNGIVHFAQDLRNAVGPHVPILWQSHTNGAPRYVARWFWKRNLQSVNGALFVSKEQAKPLHIRNILPKDIPIYEVPVSTSSFEPLPYQNCRMKLGMQDQDVFLWVGNLTSNKDPLTILHGFVQVLHGNNKAHLYMIYGSTELLTKIQRYVEQLSLTARVHLLGYIPHDLLPQYYSAADFFVSGSLNEVNGFALMEALACGVTPLVADNPAFSKITKNGVIGSLWRRGNPAEFARSAIRSKPTLSDRNAVISFFRTHYSIAVIGSTAYTIYDHAYRHRAHMTT